MKLLFFFLLLITVAECSEVISTFPHLFTDSAGKTFSKTRFSVKCDDEGPLTLQIKREDSNIVDQVTITCSAPEVVYSSQLWSYVPLGQILSRIPLSFSDDVVTNRTKEQRAYVNKLFSDSLKNTDIPPRPTRNFLSVMRRILEDTDQFNPNENNNFNQKDLSDFESDAGTPLDFDGAEGLTSWETIHFEKMALDIGLGLLTSFTSGGKGAIGGLISTAIIGGLDIGYKDPLDEVVSNLRILFNDVAQIMQVVNRLFKEQVAVNEINIQEFKQIAIAEQSIRRRQTDDEQWLQALTNRTDALTAYTDAIKKSVDGRFSTVAGDIQTLFGAESNISQAIKMLDQRDNARFTQIINTFHLMNQQVIAITDSIEGVKQNRQIIRVAALAFHRLLDVMVSELQLGPAKPFMNDIGAKPMSDQQRQAIRSKENALVIASVEIQGTRIELGNAYATQIQVEVLCDPTYIANFTLRAISFDFIIQSIGPHTSTQPYCTDPWICNCVFRTNYSSIQLPNAVQVYPFGASLGGLPMHQDPYTSQIASNCVPGQIATTCAKDPVITYFDRMDDLSAYLSGAFVCSKTTPNTPNWLLSKVRVANVRIGYFVDLSMNPSDYTGGLSEMCNADYNLASSNRTSLGFTVFTYLTKEFNLYFPTIRAAADKKLYGTLGQVAVTDYIGSRLPGLVNAYRTIIVEFVSLIGRTDSLASRLLPVYYMKKEDTRFKVNVQVNSQDGFDVNLNSTAKSVPINDSHSGNLTLTSDNQLYSIKEEVLLQDTMLWLGTETDYTGDPRTHDPDGNPLVYYDFASSELCFGGAHQRAGCLNYLEIRYADMISEQDQTFPFGEGMPFNMSMWQVNEGAVFEPNKVLSPSSSMVGINANDGTCNGNQLDPRTMLYSSAKPPKTMCLIRSHFKAPIVMKTGEIVFEARKPWTYEFVFDWQGTQIQELSITRCPDLASVTSGGTSFVLTSTTPISLKISVCSDIQGDCFVNGETISVSGTYVRTFGGVNKVYYLQAWSASDNAPTSSNRCYSQSGGKGIPLSVIRNYTYITGLPNNVETSVAQMITPTQLQMFNQQIGLLKIAQALAAVAVASSNTAIQTQVDQIITDTRNALGNVTSLGDDPVLDAVQQEAARIMNETAQAIKEAAAKAALEDNITLAAIMRQEFLTNLSAAIVDRMKNDSRLLDALVNAFINDLNNVNSGGFSLFPGLFDALKNVVNGIIKAGEGLIGALGDLLGIGGTILGNIMFIFQLLLMTCCIIACCWVGCKGYTAVKGFLPSSSSNPPPPQPQNYSYVGNERQNK